MDGIRIVERSPSDTLRRYLHQQQISLPDGYWQDALQLMAELIMEIEVSQIIEASRYERNTSRRAYRNGYRETVWSLGKYEIDIRVPKLRRGTYYPSFLDNPQTAYLITEFITQTYLNNVSFEDVTKLLIDLNIDTQPDKVADAHEKFYDLIEQYRARVLNVERVTLDLVPVEERGRRRYLALAFDEDELLEHDVTPEADDVFWQDFIRRIDGRAAGGVEYVTVGRIRHVVRLKHTRPTPQSMLMVA